jgi:hypothetical protein
MQKELVKKSVKVYGNCRTKFGYIGDGIIVQVLRKISDDLYSCDIAFEDSLDTCTISIDDIIV